MLVGIFNVRPVRAVELNAIANSGGINNACGADTVTAATYEDLAATSSFSFTKLQSSTVILIGLTVTGYCDAAAATIVRFAVRINAVDYDVAQFYFNETGTHRQMVGNRRITGINAGTYTVQVRWRRVSGSGTPTVDTSDWLTCYAMEAQ